MQAQGNTVDETPETITSSDSATDAALQSTVQQQPIAPERNTANATVQRSEKKRGLLGRLVQAVFDDK